MNIALERPDQPEVRRLIEALDAHQKPLYPPESHHGIDIAALSQPNVIFAVARAANGVAVGCGAVVLEAEFGELKRMFVSPAHRGQGVARAILDVLEREGAHRTVFRFVLETGVRQPEAVALYERAGYERCGPFGSYADDPLSVFMVKTLHFRS